MKLLALATTVAVALLAAGCGGNPGGEATPAASNFTDCLRQQGIELPTGRPSGMPDVRASGTRPSGMPRPSGGAPGGGAPGGGFTRPSNVDEATWQKALDKCGSLRPSRGPGQGPGGNEMSAYLNCLSERGITFSPGMTVPENAKVCEVLRPSTSGSRSATP